MKIIEVYFTPNGIRGGKQGCYIARLKSDHGIRDAGETKEDAISNFLVTAKSFGESGSRSDYEIEEK